MRLNRVDEELTEHLKQLGFFSRWSTDLFGYIEATRNQNKHSVRQPLLRTARELREYRDGFLADIQDRFGKEALAVLQGEDALTGWQSYYCPRCKKRNIAEENDLYTLKHCDFCRTPVGLI